MILPSPNVPLMFRALRPSWEKATLTEVFGVVLDAKIEIVGVILEKIFEPKFCLNAVA